MGDPNRPPLLAAFVSGPEGRAGARQREGDTTNMMRRRSTRSDSWQRFTGGAPCQRSLGAPVAHVVKQPACQGVASPRRTVRIASESALAAVQRMKARQYEVTGHVIQNQTKKDVTLMQSKDGCRQQPYAQRVQRQGYQRNTRRTVSMSVTPD